MVFKNNYNDNIFRGNQKLMKQCQLYYYIKQALKTAKQMSETF